MIRGAAIGLIVFGFLLGAIELVRFGAAWELKTLDEYEIQWSLVFGMLGFVALGLLIYEKGRAREGLNSFIEMMPRVLALLRNVRVGGRRNTDGDPGELDPNTGEMTSPKRLKPKVETKP